MQTMELCLWFDNNAEEAVDFYVSLFENSGINGKEYYSQASSEASGMPIDTVLTVSFELNNQKYVALNGGGVFKFTPATSIIVNCDTQEEVDNLWDAFCEEGAEMECGWLTDKYGLSWQIIPKKLNDLLSDPDPVKREKVMLAMLEMKKIETDKLIEAYNS